MMHTGKGLKTVPLAEAYAIALAKITDVSSLVNSPVPTPIVAAATPPRSSFKNIYPNRKIMKMHSARIWATVAATFSLLLATHPAMALPLQDGNYRIGSKYIQIASKGDRVCYAGKTATRVTTASVAPDSLPDFSVVNFKTDGTQEILVLHQPSVGHLLYGTVHMLRDWEADYSISLPVDDAMKRCLKSQAPFFEESKSSR